MNAIHILIRIGRADMPHRTSPAPSMAQLAVLLVVVMVGAFGCNLTAPVPVATQLDEQPFVPPGTLRVGAAKVELTPDLTAIPTKLVGYGFGRRATSIHRPLYARAVVIESGETRVALVSLDQLIVPSHMTEALRDRLSGAELNLRAIWLCATHTHSAEGGYWRQPMAEAYMMGPYAEAVELRRIIAAESAVRIAIARLRSAAIEYAAVSTTAPAPAPDSAASPSSPPPSPSLNANRRLKAAGVLDDRLGRLVFRETVGGLVIAQLFFFSAHATVLGRDDTAISGDWPGELAHLAEEQQRGSVAAVFATAIGDAAPQAPTTAGRTALSNAERATEMAKQLLHRLPALRPIPFNPDVPDDGVRLDVATLRDPLPLVDVPLVPNWLFFVEYPLAMLLDTGWMPDIAELELLRVGDLVLIGWPSEPAMAHQLALRAAAHRAGFADAWLVSNVGGWFGYTLDEHSYRSISGYEETFTLYGSTRGDHWLSMSLTALSRFPRPIALSPR